MDHENWSDLPADEAEALRTFAEGFTAERLAESRAGVVITRSGVPVTGAQRDKALAEAAARDDATHLVRMGNRAVERAAVEEAFASVDPAQTLEDFLNESDEDVQWHVRGLIVKDAKVLIVAQHKTGKTTLLVALVKTYADGVDFLGSFQSDVPVEGAVVVVDAEMPPEMLRADYRTAGIKNTDRVRLVSLRANKHRNTLLCITDPDVQDFWVEYLVSVKAGALLLDPAADFFRACGLDEDRKEGWEEFQNAVQSICVRAGVGTHAVVHHTGWEKGRGRGSSRQYDDPDVIITLTKEGDDVPGSFDPETGTFTTAPTPARRLISAIGRKVTVPKSTLRLLPNGVDLEVDFGASVSTATGVEGGPVSEAKAEEALLVGLFYEPKPASERRLVALSADHGGHSHKRYVTPTAMKLFQDGLLANPALNADGSSVEGKHNRWSLTAAGQNEARDLIAAEETDGVAHSESEEAL